MKWKTSTRFTRDPQPPLSVPREAKKKVSEGSDSKVVITGDDVLIEYVARLIKIMKEVPEVENVDLVEINIEKFIAHYVWHKDDYPKKSFWWRLENRLSEMQSRRRKLLKSLCKKDLEKKGDAIEEGRVERIIKEKEA